MTDSADPRNAAAMAQLEAATAKLIGMTGEPIEVEEGDIRVALPILPETEAPATAAQQPVLPDLRRSQLTVRLTHDNMTELLADVCATRYPWIGRIVAEWLPDAVTGKALAVCEVSLLLPVGMSYDDQESSFITSLGKEGRKNRDMRDTIKQMRELLDRYDGDATRCRNLLTQAGVAETVESDPDPAGNVAIMALSLPERLKLLIDVASARGTELAEAGRAGTYGPAGAAGVGAAYASAPPAAEVTQLTR
jgi:hypothetical protein